MVGESGGVPGELVHVRAGVVGTGGGLVGGGVVRRGRHALRVDDDSDKCSKGVRTRVPTGSWPAWWKLAPRRVLRSKVRGVDIEWSGPAPLSEQVPRNLSRVKRCDTRPAVMRISVGDRLG